MAVDSVGTTLNNDNLNLQRAGFGEEDFLKVLLTQLTYQDPLKPIDNQQFMAQFAQFSSLEQSRQSNQNTEAMLNMQSSNQALGLLNKSVEVKIDTGSVIGEVSAVAFRQGTPLLSIKTANGEFLTDVRLSQINIVR